MSMNPPGGTDNTPDDRAAAEMLQPKSPAPGRTPTTLKRLA